MEASIYDQEMETLGDLQLFGGQLQDICVQSSFADLRGGQVLQTSWHDDFVGKSYQRSDVDFLEDPVWQYTFDVTDTKDVLSSAVQEGSSLYEDDIYDLLSSSPEEAYLPVDDDHLIINVTSPVDNGSNFIVPSYHSGSDLSDAKFDYRNTLSGQRFLISDVPQNLSQDQKINVQKSHDLNISKEDIRTYSFALERGDALDGLHYENHYKSEVELDGIACDNDALLDDERVCQILQQLVAIHSNSCRPVLLSVSPEEVELVLSSDSRQTFVEDYDSVPVSCSPSVPSSSPVTSSSPVSSISFLPMSEAALSPASVITTDYRRDCLSVASSTSPTSSPGIPYCVEARSYRKLKKKEQNKTAALRYRNKKREEKGVVYTEVEILEQKNAELQAKAHDLTKEINYLKSLLEEIRRQ